MTHPAHRSGCETDSFNEVLIEQLRRTPWLLTSLLVHGVIIVALMIFAAPEPSTAERHVAELRLDEPPLDDEPELLDEPRVESPQIEDVMEEPFRAEETRDPRVETAAEEHFEEAKGEETFPSEFVFDARDSSGVIGVGAGGGGGLIGRRKGRVRARRGAGRRAQLAVDGGLSWLARHQSRDGRWDADGFMANGDAAHGVLCDGPGSPLYDTGITGLALLCFLGAGETHRSGKYRKNVARGLRWLRSQQDAEGCFAPRTLSNFAYGHAIATLAMTEAYGATKSPSWKEAAEKGIAFCLACQNDYGAWRYTKKPGENDTSVTGWMVMALESAKAAGIPLDERPFAWASRFIASMTDGETGRVGYVERGGLPVREEGKARAFPASETEALTAVGVTARIFCGEAPRENPALRLAVENLLSKKLPVWDPGRGSIDMYYWYYGTLAMFQYGGEAWSRWNRAMHGAIVSRQRDDGNFAGSWDPIGAWGEQGGRVYATALMTLCLEVYYRYGRVFGTR